MAGKVSSKLGFVKQVEKLGFVIAVGVMLLFVVWALMPSGAGGATAEEIKKAEKTAQENMTRSKPQSSKELIPTEIVHAPEQLLQMARLDNIDPALYHLEHEFMGESPESEYRLSNPDVYVPASLLAAPVKIPTRILVRDGDKLLVLEDLKGIEVKATTAENRREQIDFQKAQAEAKRKKGSSPGGRPSGPSGGRGRGKGADKQASPPPAAPPAGGNQVTGRAVWKPAAQVQSQDLNKVAVTLMPFRGVVVVGAFPLGQQMREMAKALKLKDDQVAHFFFEKKLAIFNGLDIQRREIIRKGTRLEDGTVADQDLVRMPEDGSLKPLEPETGWLLLDVDDLKALLAEAEEFEEQTLPKELLRSNLTWKLPKTERGGSYPDLAGQLPEIQQAREKLLADPKASEPKPKGEERRRPDPFSQDDDDATTPGRGANPSNPSTPQTPAGRTPGEKLDLWPDHCLLRFIDLDPDTSGPINAYSIRPRQTFEYRVRVVLNNPNYKQDNLVADPAYAKDDVIKSAWSKPTAPITIPDETYMYADLRQRSSGSGGLDRDTHKVPVALHKWLDFVSKPPPGNEQSPVGAWWVDRLLVARGEYIGRTEEKKLIVWVPTKVDVASKKIGADDLASLRTDTLTTRTLLVDFDGGHRVQRMFDHRSWPGGGYEDPPAEVLLVDAKTGKLTAHRQLADKEEPGSKSRFEDWERWWSAVKQQSESKTKPEKERDAFDK